MHDLQITHTVRMRYLAGIMADMRIIHDDRILEIVGPPANTLELNEELVFQCVEKT
jgi:SPP1 family predicted phage head-tail adaptor